MYPARTLSMLAWPASNADLTLVEGPLAPHRLLSPGYPVLATFGFIMALHIPFVSSRDALYLPRVVPSDCAGSSLAVGTRPYVAASHLCPGSLHLRLRSLFPCHGLSKFLRVRVGKDRERARRYGSRVSSLEQREFGLFLLHLRYVDTLRVHPIALLIKL